MNVGSHEHDVVDVLVGDELQDLGTLSRVAFEAILRDQHAEVLHGLGRQDEFPHDAPLLGTHKLPLQIIQLCSAEHGARRVERLEQEAPDVRGVRKVRRNQFLVAERTVVEDDHRGGIAVGSRPEQFWLAVPCADRRYFP